eukprot:354857-Chlamydomonas_euryale.AAC.32
MATLSCFPIVRRRPCKLLLVGCFTSHRHALVGSTASVLQIEVAKYPSKQLSTHPPPATLRSAWIPESNQNLQASSAVFIHDQGLQDKSCVFAFRHLTLRPGTEEPDARVPGVGGGVAMPACHRDDISGRQKA